MDFREYDRIDEDPLNRILWHSIKGVDVPYPAPVHRALPTLLGLFRFPKEADWRTTRKWCLGRESRVASRQSPALDRCYG